MTGTPLVLPVPAGLRASRAESAELTSSPGADSTISSVITPSSMMAA